MQEITMPEPSQSSQQGGSTSTAQPSPDTAKGKQNSLILPVAIGAAILVLGGAGAFLALHKNTPAAPPPVATTPTPAPAPTPAPPQVTASKPVSTPAGDINQCRAIWDFNQDSGNTITDTTGNGNKARVIGDTAVWLKPTDPSGPGLRVTGSNYVEAADAIINTTQSFTAMIWVNLDTIKVKKYQALMSIDGKEMFGFILQFNPYAGQSGGRFEFARLDSDSSAAEKFAAKSKPTLTSNTWYHLAAVYDADAQAISLYLNGELQETTTFRNPWQATGKTVIGRGRSNGHNGSYLDGVVRDARIYASALTDEQIKKLAK
jgi:hypothetical protein